MAKTKPFDKNYLQYEEWFEKNRYAYQSELKAIKYFIPKNKKGIEIGIGSGRFAEPLGIKIGVEPSEKMRKLAEKRGLKGINGVAENLPVKDESYDFVLMVTTICFVDDIRKSFQEVKRILKKNGSFIIGFVDKDSPLGTEYQKHKKDNFFYQEATFYSTAEVLKILNDCDFKNIQVVQTVFGNLKTIKAIQDLKEGYGEGGFVVIKADK